MSADGDGRCLLPEVLEVNPEGILPCVIVNGGKWAVWESGVVMEYLEDLTVGKGRTPLNGDGDDGGGSYNLLPSLSNPQLRAHCRVWTDHINRKILPLFYSLLLAPTMETTRPETSDPIDTTSIQQRQATLTSLLQSSITLLVNASHATGPFFLGSQISFVDVAFAPWIIRLSRVLSHYRDFPRPEVNTRWARWVNAVEHHECVRRTVSDEGSYHNVYGGAACDEVIKPGSDVAMGARMMKMVEEVEFARGVVRQEGFGLGGDFVGHVRTRFEPQTMR